MQCPCIHTLPMIGNIQKAAFSIKRRVHETLPLRVEPWASNHGKMLVRLLMITVPVCTFSQCVWRNRVIKELCLNYLVMDFLFFGSFSPGQKLLLATLALLKILPEWLQWLQTKLKFLPSLVFHTKMEVVALVPLTYRMFWFLVVQ